MRLFTSMSFFCGWQCGQLEWTEGSGYFHLLHPPEHERLIRAEKGGLTVATPFQSAVTNFWTLTHIATSGVWLVDVVHLSLLPAQTGDFAGESTSGRRRWQQRRGKGKHGGGGKKARSKKTANRFDLPV